MLFKGKEGRKREDNFWFLLAFESFLLFLFLYSCRKVSWDGFPYHVRVYAYHQRVLFIRTETKRTLQF